MAKQSNRRSRQKRREGHRIGTGPGNIFLHAVSRRVQAGGPVAVCGHPLRMSPEGTGNALPADMSFEEVSRTNQDACTECARLLDVDIGARTPPAPAADEGGFPILNRVSGAAAVAVLVMLMVAARLALLLFR